MRDAKAEMMAKKAELQATIKAASNRDLLVECARAAIPDKKEAAVAVLADVALAAVCGEGLVKSIELAVAAGAVYSVVRSGVMAHREWAELGRRCVQRSNKAREERIAALEAMVHQPLKVPADK